MRLLQSNHPILRGSRISFGTAALHHLHSAADRQRLILAAADAGITHFDTSPYYGFGIAESALAVLASRASTISVATKVGLYPPGGSDPSTLGVWSRKAAGHIFSRLSRPLVDFHVARARASLSGSLRRLSRERVDVLFLHEPHRELVETDEWMRWIEAEKDRIGAIGVAGEADRVLPFVKARSPLATVVQTRDSLIRQQAEPLRAAGRSPDITYGHLARPDAAGRITEILEQTIERWPDTIILVSTRRVARIRELECIVLTSEAPLQRGVPHDSRA